MEVQPVDLKLQADGNLLIHWSDGEVRRYTPEEIHEACPSAEALEHRKAESERPKTALPILQAEERNPRRIVGMRPVGNYAYNIRFNHGFQTGIYRFELLRELGRPLTEKER